MQNPTHLATKWRNRLLCSTAQLMMGPQLISIEHLQDIIDSNAYSKLDHGLVRTDINLKDRQNYRSCEKLTSNDLLNIVRNNPSTSGTFVIFNHNPVY
ncbi:unnamed protein product [Didymodactylos carnosus]|uniref:Uncharacterized protein n=2 Tax=Didymodactylos carnosus TaxID=1234261 RepID=A0A8S2FBF4_9BILA|nr:unnamed protein product [Didymodactylos carnosus]CAF4215914.1 unnamed protein product [Didymodactylos carnosus]